MSVRIEQTFTLNTYSFKDGHEGVKEIVREISNIFSIPIYDLETEEIVVDHRIVTLLRFRDQCGIIARFEPFKYDANCLATPVIITVPQDMREQYEKHLKAKEQQRMISTLNNQ